MPSKDLEKRRKHSRTHYDKHKQEYLERNKKRVKATEIEVNKLKSEPCTDCGLKYNPWQMDYDHITSDKKFDIARGVKNGLCLDSLLTEIAKCELVCSNCHKNRTHSRNQALSSSG